MARLEKEDQAAIRQLWTTFKAAFNKKDARAIALLFAADGDLIGVEGELVTGPATIEAYYVERFSQLLTAKVGKSKISPARTLADRVALANGTWQVLGVGPDPIDVAGTFVVKKHRGTWHYLAARFIKPIDVP